MMDIDKEISSAMNVDQPQQQQPQQRGAVQQYKLDLESYIQNYAGHPKIARLIFLADVCQPLRTDVYNPNEGTQDGTHRAETDQKRQSVQPIGI
jgi:hypothetical protein